MRLKLFGIGVTSFGVYLIYMKRHLNDDSLLLGSALILTGILTITVGWMVRMDSRKH